MGSAGSDPRLTIRPDCRYCGSPALRLVLDLGDQPVSNAFISPSEIANERRYPLQAYVCEACWLVQLRHVVDARVIFDDYAYLSSTSGALVRHYRGLVERLSSEMALRSGDVVVDIGCNDGILLRAYDPTVVRVGVEPSRVAEIARGHGLAVVQSFFGAEVAREIRSTYGPARIVTATNVFAHVDDIAAFARAVPMLLTDDGIFVLEVSYLPELVRGRLFDTIYHEHLCYCALTPMVPFLERCGLAVVDAEQVAIGASGPAIRVTARAAGARPGPRVAALLEEERAWGVRSVETYERFAADVGAVRERLLRLLRSLRRDGARIAGFGAPAKGNTLLNSIGADPELIEFVADNTPLKRGKLTPGTHIPVVGDEELLQRMPPYALLLAWNYLDHFLGNSEYIARGGRFVVPLPEPRIVP